MLLWALTAGSAGLTAASFVSGLGWAAELAAAFRPHYASVGTVGLAGMTLARRWTGVAVAAGVTAVNAAALAPLWVDGPVEGIPPAGTRTLTVLWHNVHHVGVDRQKDLVAAVVSSDADVVVLAQVDPNLSTALRRSEALGREVVHEERGRILVLARVPVTDAEPVRPLPDGSRFTAVALEVEMTPGRTVAILGLHTLSPRTPRRAAIRDAELAVAGSWAATQDGPTVVVGDLNTIPWSRPFRDLARRGGLRDSLRGHGLQPTWPARWGLTSVPIDHALHSPDLTVVARTTGPAIGSFHRSLVVTFALAQPRSDAEPNG